MTSFIKIQNLTFRYVQEDGKSTDILKQIDLDIKQGEFVSLLGHNGCGKSTLAKCFNALILPSSGKVLIDGIDTLIEDKLYDIRKKVGLVLQNPDNQIVAGVVEDDVAFGPENLGLDPEEIRRRVEQSLKDVGMYEYSKISPHRLSGGQKQRVAIAGILAMKPECIVLDEPTSMLDPLGRKEVLDVIKKLNREYGITVILITHFMEEAVWSDRVLVMHQGKIVMDDKPRNLFANVSLLRKAYLDVPAPTQLINSLCEYGLDLPGPVLNVCECIDVLRSYIGLHGKNTDVCNNINGCSQKETQKIKLKLENVSFCYGEGTSFEHKALENINVNFCDGDFISIVGHTGSGKTTLIQLLNGLIKPSMGKVYLDGEDINSMKKDRRIHFKVGLVFQYPEYQLFEETVLKDIAFGPGNMNLNEKEIRQRVLMATEFVGLNPELLSKSPFELSGGEKRKAAIAGIIAMDPDVLILDEPTAGLDPFWKKNLLENIKRYHEIRKNTIIMVSHNMEDVAETSDKVLVMSNGRVELFSDTKEIFSKTDYMEKLGIGVPPITKIMYELKKSGFNVDGATLNVEDAVTQIRRLLNK